MYLKSHAFEVDHWEKGPLLQPSESVVVQMKDLQELQLGEGGLAQTDEVSVRQIHYAKVGQLRELEPVKRPTTKQMDG